MRTVFIHILAWMAFTGYLLMISYNNYRPQFEPDFIVFKQVLTIIVILTPFYVNYFLVTPYTLLQKKSYPLFLIGILLLMGLHSLLDIGVLNALDWYLGSEDFRENVTFLNSVKSLVTPILFLAISGGLRVSKEYYANSRKQLQLEHQVAEAELQMLKSQINPHFLFNSLNNIYGLTQKKSDHAPDAVIKLSEMMRYLLHESNQPKVSLAKEIELLNNFIFLQKLRMVDASKVNFIPAYDGTLTITPLLLIPLLENAFKHSDLTNQRVPISIDLVVKGTQLTFHLVNGIDTVEKHEYSGIGIENLRRRLALLYKDRHHLELDQKDEKFFANLVLDLG